MREKGPHETGAREAGKAGATGFLRSPFLGALGNPLIELPERFPARPSVTPIFEYRRTSIISERLGLENREWNLALEAVAEVVWERKMPAWG